MLCEGGLMWHACCLPKVPIHSSATASTIGAAFIMLRNLVGQAAVLSCCQTRPSMEAPISSFGMSRHAPEMAIPASRLLLLSAFLPNIFIGIKNLHVQELSSPFHLIGLPKRTNRQVIGQRVKTSDKQCAPTTTSSTTLSSLVIAICRLMNGSAVNGPNVQHL